VLWLCCCLHLFLVLFFFFARQMTSKRMDEIRHTHT
jgi:hypothetical protein